MRVILSGGGTGGHISPLLAVADKLRQSEESELLYIGSKGGMEERLVPESGIPFKAISAGKLRRYKRKFLRAALDLPTNLKNLADAGRTMAGFAQSLSAIRRFRPDVVLLKGGYVSLPVGLAAALLKVPFAIHESDAEAGLANRFLSKYADRVFIAFPMVWGLPKEKAIYTGTPVRSDILAATAGARDLERFGFKEENLPVLLVIGGSQGAREINKALYGALNDLLARVQIIHVSGEHDLAWLKHERDKLIPELKTRYYLAPYLSTELPSAYLTSDLVIARAGANVMAEIAAMGKPSILIPHYYGGNEHQLKNAQVFGREGAATILRPDELTPEIFKEAVLKELSDKTLLSERAKRAKALHKSDAALIIANELKFISKRKSREEGANR